jgi:hypothetical protein
MLLDLRDIPVVDNHCHGVLSGTAPIDVAELRHRFSECAGDPFPPDHTSTTAHYLWMLRQVAEVLGCEPDEDAVVAARAERSRDELDGLFLRSAGIAWLLIDDGYPDPATVSSRDETAARLGGQVGWVERIETVAARLIGEHERFADFDEALRVHLGSARERGVVGLKSVAACEAASRSPSRSGTRRRRPSGGPASCPGTAQEKHLVDHVVMLIMEAAHTQSLPVQFHTGYGDSDANLILADPLLLAPLMRLFPECPW